LCQLKQAEVSKLSAEIECRTQTAKWALADEKAAHQYLPRVQMDLALQQITEIRRFNRASTRLTVTAIIVSATQVIVGLIALFIAFHK
jgi:hypothetical protein